MRKRKQVPYQRIILQTLAVAGAVTLATLAPHVLAELKKLDPALAKRKDTRRRIQQTLWRMERNQLVSLPSSGSMGRVELLPKGDALIERIQAQEYQIQKPLVWDGKWRFVIFDVPEKRKVVREQLRVLLQRAGLIRLHDSVWVHPFSCDELVVLVKAHLRNTKGEVRYIVGDLIESDRYLREEFGLVS